MRGGSSTYSASIENAENYMAWVISQFKPYLRGRVLEVGLGHGGYRRYLDQVQYYTGVDIDHDSIMHARKANPDDTFIQADICDDRFSRQNANTFDAVLCINVLEHIQEDGKAVAHLLQVLRTGGKLLLMVPAHPLLFSSLDRLAGHCRRYDRKGVEALFPDGARINKCYYINPIGGVGWWINKWFGHRDLNSRSVNLQIMLFDRFIVPLSRILSLLTKKVFGQSVICIVTREGVV